MAKDKKSTEYETLPAKLEDSPFAVCRADLEQVRDIISLNLGGKKVTPFKLDRIRIPDGESDFWTVPTLDGSMPAEKLHGIMVHKKFMRAWWPDLDPTGKPPRCKSDDAVWGIGCRSVGEHYPNDPADERHECQICKFAQFETDPKGGKGQWCKEMRAVFFLREETFIPTVIFLPPTSIQSFDSYCLTLGTYGVPFNSLIVSFTLEKDKNPAGKKFNKCVLKRARKLSKEEYGVIRAYTKMIAPALDAVTMEEDDYNTDNTGARTGDPVKTPDGSEPKKAEASA